jgi:hypothetical protein
LQLHTVDIQIFLPPLTIAELLKKSGKAIAAPDDIGASSTKFADREIKNTKPEWLEYAGLR